MKSRKIMAVLLMFAVLLTVLPSSLVMATDDMPVITVQSVTDTAGSAVNVDVEIANNPGILGATLEFTYDSGLTLINAANGEAFSMLTMTKPGKFTSPCKFVWDGQDLSSEDVKDGVILTLQFKIEDEAKSGVEYQIKINCDKDDIVNENLDSIDVKLVNGSVGVIDYVPGDLDGDKNVNSKDIVLLRRTLASGYEQTVNESAADVNSDGKLNTKDIILVRRYVAGGYGVVLTPSKPKCEHKMTEYPYKAPTITEDGNIAYWSCSECNKLFSDASGTTEISEEDIVISRLEGYSIKYITDSNDKYLQSLTIDNPNPEYYENGEIVELEDLLVPGYNFVGWYTAQTGGERVTRIESGETGNKVLYAHWEKVTYTVSFASDMVPVESVSYSVGESIPLSKPTLDKYTFVGWSDKNGKIWSEIPAGTTGNITLYANWASNRNKAVAKKNLDDPIICEDSKNGVILFTYEIGEIQNVPLFTMFKLNCANGIISSTVKEETDEILESQAKTIASTVSKATTDSSSWTLSSDWNKNTEVSTTYLEQTSQTREEAETLAKSSSNTYNLTNSSGGSSGVSLMNSDSYKLSQNVAHSVTTTEETGQNFELSVDAKYSYELSAGLKIPIESLGDLSVGSKSGFEIGAGIDYSNYIKNTTTGTVGFSDTVDESKEMSSTYTAEKTWNTAESFSNSNSVSKSSAISNAVSNLVSEQYGYGSSYAEGGSNSESKELATTDSKSDEYSAAVTYNSSKIVSTRTEYSSTGETVGDYRLVMAGTVHVFAVVGYDIATSSYFTYTYNIMDDETEEYLDYSRDGTFDDYENSIIPFEIPYFVNEYVNSRIAKTEGFKFDPDTGMIVGYTATGSEPDTVIVVPSYISVDNNDGTYKAVKVTGIKEGLFKNNTDLVAIQLGKYITEIPNSAFEGCTALKAVVCPGVTRIGNNAFKECESLSTFSVSENIENIGNNAFENTPKITVVAQNSDVALAAASSGAKNISLDISNISDNDSNGMAFEVGEIESFELIGKDKEYKGLSVKSDAETTIINGITFTENKKVPLEVTSENVILDRVTIDCTGYAAIFKSDSTNLRLNRTNTMLSGTGNTMISKNLMLSSRDSSIVGKLNVTGNILVCGTVSDDEECLNITNGEIITITDEEFENYINSHKVSFDANGGIVGEESRMVAMNSSMGELPVPSRDYYSFDGWYTSVSGGEKVTAETLMTSLTDITLYAHWIQNGVSAWTLASNVPSDAEIVNKKWTYTLTSYTTSSSSSLSGWTQYDSTWKWSDYGSWSGWQDSYVASSDSRDVRTQSVVSGYNKKTQWIYSRARSSSGDKAYGWQTSYCTIVEGTGWLDSPLAYQAEHSCGPAYGKGFRNAAGVVYSGIYWYNEATQIVDDYNSPIYKTQYSYRDRSKIYTLSLIHI